MRCGSLLSALWMDRVPPVDKKEKLIWLTARLLSDQAGAEVALTSAMSRHVESLLRIGRSVGTVGVTKASTPQQSSLQQQQLLWERALPCERQRNAWPCDFVTCELKARCYPDPRAP